MWGGEGGPGWAHPEPVQYIQKGSEAAAEHRSALTQISEPPVDSHTGQLAASTFDIIIVCSLRRASFLPEAPPPQLRPAPHPCPPPPCPATWHLHR